MLTGMEEVEDEYALIIRQVSCPIPYPIGPVTKKNDRLFIYISASFIHLNPDAFEKIIRMLFRADIGIIDTFAVTTRPVDQP